MPVVKKAIAKSKSTANDHRPMTAGKTAPPAKKVSSAKPPAKKATAPAKATRSTRTVSKPQPKVQDTPKPSQPRRGRQKAPDVVVQLPLAQRAAQVDLNKRIGGLSLKQLAEVTGYSPGSEGFTAAIEVLRGADTRQEVNHRVAALLPPTSRNGSPKNVSNLVSSVIRRMESKGFTVKGSWRMIKPAAE